MATEFEIKLRAKSVEQLGEILRDAQVVKFAQEKLREIHMRTTYFDTADEGYARGEWECEGKTPEEAIGTLVSKGAPEELLTLTKAGLQMVCGAEFVRLTQPLRLPDGTTCEICADGGELLGGRHKEPFCELELELTRGDGKALLAFAGELSRKYGLIEEQKSKFVRARRLADGK